MAQCYWTSTVNGKRHGYQPLHGATSQQLPGLHSDQSYHNFKICNNNHKPSVLRSKTSATNNGTWKHPTETPTINQHHQANCCWITPFQIQTKSFYAYIAKLVCQISPTNNRDTIFSAFPNHTTMQGLPRRSNIDSINTPRLPTLKFKIPGLRHWQRNIAPSLTNKST